MNPIHTGRYIRQQRKALGLSQSKLAEMLFVEPQTVSKWERGLGMPDYDNVDRLREIFGCTLSDILEPVFEDDDGTIDTPTDSQPSGATNLPILVGIIEDNEEKSEGKKKFSIFDLLNKKKIKEILERMFGYEYANTYNEKFLFAGLFKRRTREEYENTLTQGMFRDSVNHKVIGLEAPWLYIRLLLFLLICTGISFLAAFSSPMPFVIMGGLCSILPMMMFLFESNYPRNLSFIDVLKMFTLGGLASIALTLLNPLAYSWNEVLSAVVFAPLFEETFKAALAIFFIARIKPKNMLTGMLVGFSVGAGFCFFENVHYAFSMAVSGALYGDEIEAIILPVLTIIVRTASQLLHGHHYYTGIFAAIYVLFKERAEFNFRDLFQWKVIVAPAYSITLHTVWNAASCISVPVLPLIMQALVCIASFVLLIVLINVGIAQTRIMGIWEDYRSEHNASAEQPEEEEGAPARSSFATE